MRFYIGQKQVKIAVAPEYTDTQDETPSTFRCELELNDDANAYAPMQEFSIIWDNGTTTKLILLTDEVTIASFNPLKYKHSLTLIQNIHFLSKHLCRDSIFSQPSRERRKSIYSFTSAYDAVEGYRRFRVLLQDLTRIPVDWNIGLLIGKKEKISSFNYKINVYKSVAQAQGNPKLEKVENASDILSTLRFFIVIEKNGVIVDQIPVIQNIDDLELDKYYQVDGLYNVSDANIKIVATGNNISFKPLDDNKGCVIFNLEYYADVYYFNCYDILDICIKQYQKKRNNLLDEPPLFNLPSVDSELGQLLTNTIPPNLVFKQNTFYQVVSQVFSLFDAIFTLDSNNVLGIEYLNDRQTVLSSVKLSSVGRSYKEDNYNNRMVNHYQNAIMDYEYPSSSFARATSQNVGTPTADDHILKFPEPIDYIEEMYIRYTGNIFIGGTTIDEQTWNITLEVKDFALDVSYFFLLTDQWGLLDTGTEYPIRTPIVINEITTNLYSYSRLVKNCVMQYAKGSTSISLSQKVKPELEELLVLRRTVEGALRMFIGWDICNTPTPYCYQPNLTVDLPSLDETTADYNSIYARGKFITNTNGALSIETSIDKYKGDYLTSQSGSNVDLHKMGVNLVGVSLRTGNELMTATQEITTMENAIKKGDYFFDSGGQYWVANVVKYTIYNDKVIANIEFTKNYNSLNLNTRIDKEIRLSNIDNAYADKCVELINEYVYVSLTEKPAPLYRSAISQDFIVGSFARNLGYNYERVISYVAFKNKEDVTPIYIPTKFYTAGFNICIESSFNDAISAGIRNARKIQYEYNMQPTLYAGENGFSDSCDVYYVYDEQVSEFDDDFPYVSREKVYEEDTIVGGLTDFYYYKKPNEIFSINYQLVFFGEDVFIGKQFMQNNFLIKQNEKKLYLYVTTTGNYSILDTKVLEDSIKLEITNVEVEGNEVSITADYGDLIIPSHNWAIGDNEGNLYLSSNVRKLRGSKIVLYLTASAKRL